MWQLVLVLLEEGTEAEVELVEVAGPSLFQPILLKDLSQPLIVPLPYREVEMTPETGLSITSPTPRSARAKSKPWGPDPRACR